MSDRREKCLTLRDRIANNIHLINNAHNRYKGAKYVNVLTELHESNKTILQFLKIYGCRGLDQIYLTNEPPVRKTSIKRKPRVVGMKRKST
jgi:hypothetical protein